MALQISFGAMVDRLRDQPVGKLLPADACASYQKFADAITTLTVHGILSGREASAARTRLGKRIVNQAVRTTPQEGR